MYNFINVSYVTVIIVKYYHLKVTTFYYLVNLYRGRSRYICTPSNCVISLVQCCRCYILAIYKICCNDILHFFCMFWE